MRPLAAPPSQAPCLVDLRSPLSSDVALEIVTAKDPQGGEVFRHSAEHVMADAVKRLFPTVQIDVGRTDHSEKFQYDFLTESPFTPEELERIEAEMKRILAEDAAFAREEVSREEAKRLFGSMGEELKVSRIDDIPEVSRLRSSGMASLSICAGAPMFSTPVKSAPSSCSRRPGRSAWG